MRIFVIVICSLALASVAYGAQPEKNKQQKKKQPQAAQHAPPPTAGHATGAGAGPKKTSMGAYQGKKGQTQMGAYEGQKGKKGQTSMGAYEGQKGKKGQTQMGAYEGQKGKKGQTSMGAYEGQKAKHGQTSAEAYQGHKGNKGQTSVERYEGQKGKKGQGSMGAYEGQKGKKSQTSVEAYHGQKGKKGQTQMGAYQGQTGKVAKGGKVTGAGKPFKPQHFNLPTKTTPTKITAVNFQQGRHIQRSQNWQGSKYQVFRNYKSEWHDQGWWRSHYNNRVVFVYGGWYAWDAGYWRPAWGYAPNAYYAYDGPIYGYNNLPPDQVIANVQSALQQHGYYQGEVDGLLGPQTRAAIADYQRATGLPETASVDQPTLESLGMS
jgi:hypothetical protein